LAGIYIHIPFCRQACHYCNFHFSTSLRYKNEFLAALLKEMELFSSAEGGRSHQNSDTIETIYFGGGTPSLLTADEINSIIQKVNTHFTVAPDAEITLEANPDDISASKLDTWKQAGINRLSLGIQSFFEEDLRWMNRAHDAKQAIDSLELAITRFPNITIDLIYGTPQLTNDKWKQNVEKAVSLNIPHLSCYALTVEPKTPLDKMIRQQQSPEIDTDKQSQQFLLLMQWMEEAGYEHYEISNFAKPGMRSRHNSSYWKSKNYYGFGPSAHSFDGKARWWNIANNNTYIQSIQNNLLPVEKEELTTTQKMNEYIMISLRTMEGLDLDKAQAIGPSHYIKEHLLSNSKKFEERGLLEINGNTIRLTKEGKLMADGIAADLFWVDN
jgi:oxygen-independent coproporphyrinogen III oxidase